ncbi:hypothetical protein HanRHA438_Chr13g0603881 [Helianthus annuus]|uniref:Uncharacterized protein n=1 Tax=Helianthus annuus TaxID=4232 RepID=A0A251SSY3_HELAN|nr:hypothetical protein HanXRQr2_Chr13g0593281 [Helianthus annuus]KAJ0664108.1 hypothetical protein HanLR1_Chr13g0488561 [Helianthus annuus]KAJ0671586.1 hypothetical protein HanOQP8_Chr13g0487221 [Helianthus annuus]KAJ0849650.1 hypothetical protein HanPSC8_Chr13g0571311 [Helianthus annuus]KAJ0858685.1 hypothetical protein HanRHA438_Chr13g0603881 [Helianthus annuus]
MPLYSEFAVSFFKSSSLATSPELLSALYVGGFKKLHFSLQQHHWRRCMWVGSAAKNCVYSNLTHVPVPRPEKSDDSGHRILCPAGGFE